MTIAPTATRHHRPSLRWALVGLTGFVALSALYGGIGLALDGLGMPESWLDGTPFGSWFLPGLALLLLVFVPQAVALRATLRDGAGADRTALVAGLVLMGWIVVQVLVLQRYFFLQPVIFLLGAAEATLAWLRSRPT